MAVTCWMMSGSSWLGIHYLPTPTITMVGCAGGPVLPASMAMGATQWTAVDANNVIVGGGTMLATASSITVVTSGVWTGGTTVVPGYYTIYTNSGTNGVVVGSCVVCPTTSAASNLYVPPTTVNVTSPTGSPAIAGFSAWMGIGPDRDFYALEYNLVYGHATTASDIITNLAVDPYYVGPQDSNRPHKVWIAPGPQASSPTQDPTPTSWGTAAAALAAAGYTGAYYELPTNEPENGGWTLANIISYWDSAAAAVIAADSTAHCMGFDSGGIYNNTPLTGLATFLADSYVNAHISAFTNHMENSHQNLSNIVMLRQYFGTIKAQFAASGLTNLDLWMTENGIWAAGPPSGVWPPGVLQPRREARQRTIIRLVAESYGWSKEHSYDFPVYDHHGIGIAGGGYLVDVPAGGSGYSGFGGNMKAGAYALHVMSEALFGTTCTPTNKPATLSFGGAGSIGDSLFFGLHYTATGGDRVVLCTNGLESDTVTLNVSSSTGVKAWDGWGNTRAVTVSGSQITVAVDDLPTYIFLPASTTVSVVDTGSNVISKLNGARDIATSATITNEASTNISGVINDGSFAQNNSGITGISAPYTDSTFPGSITASSFYGSSTPQNVEAIVLFTGGPAWQGAGCSITGFNVCINGSTTPVYTYTQSGAVSYPIPAAASSNSTDVPLRTTWWKDPFAWIVPLNQTGVTSVTVNITGVSYGGQPDAAASAYEGSAQQIQIAEFQVLQAPTAGPGRPSLLRAVG